MFDNALLPDKDTLASNEFESVDRRLPNEVEFNILNLIKPNCPKCGKDNRGTWHLLCGSDDGIPIEIYWLCWNHPEKSEEWPSIQYNLNDFIRKFSE